MIFHVTGRRGGKTTKMLEWMQDAPEGEHRVLVSHNRHQAMTLLRQARNDGLPLESWQFVGLDEVKSDSGTAVLRGRGGRIVLGIDDVDCALPRLLGFEIGRVSAMGEMDA